MRLVLLVLAVCLALCPLAHAPRAAEQGTLDDIVVVVADTDGLTVDFEITVAMTEYYDEDPVAFLGDHFETTYYDATATLLVP